VLPRARLGRARPFYLSSNDATLARPHLLMVKSAVGGYGQNNVQQSDNKHHAYPVFITYSQA
jgi:hypothetical protein